MLHAFVMYLLYISSNNASITASTIHLYKSILKNSQTRPRRFLLLKYVQISLLQSKLYMDVLRYLNFKSSFNLQWYCSRDLIWIKVLDIKLLPKPFNSNCLISYLDQICRIISLFEVLEFLHKKTFAVF